MVIAATQTLLITNPREYLTLLTQIIARDGRSSECSLAANSLPSVGTGGAEKIEAREAITAVMYSIVKFAMTG